MISDGRLFVGPNKGEMAESGEAGIGRMAEPLEIVAAIEDIFSMEPERIALAGRRMLVTSGPTREPIDPVRFLSNRSSGRQGHAIAFAAARAGADVLLVSGPVDIPDPEGVKTVHVETAREMLEAAEAALPADAAVCVAAVADWRVEARAQEKLKKTGDTPPALSLVENPDVLRAHFPSCAATQARGRLRRRDREAHRARTGEAQEEGLRLDRGQRRLRPIRGARRRGQPDLSGDRKGRRVAWPLQTKEGGRQRAGEADRRGVAERGANA